MPGYGEQYGIGQFGEEYVPREAECCWTERLYTDFSNPPSVSTDPGNGSVSESSSVLTLSTPSGVDCDWWASKPYSPLAYLPFTDKVQYPPEVVRLQTRVTDYVNNSGGLGGVNIMLCLFKDRQNMYGFGWAYDYSFGAIIRGMKLVANVGTAIGVTGSGISDPSTVPHIYRLYWNPGPDPRYVPEISTVMEPNQIRFYYSIDDGATFAPGVAPFAATAEIDPPFKIGVSVKTWNNKPAVNIEFSALQVVQWDPECEEWIPYRPYTPVQQEETAGLEDEISIPNFEGPSRFDLPEVGGPVALAGDRTGLEDGIFIPNLEGSPRFDLPDIGSPIAPPASKVGLEDALVHFLMNEPEISQATYDSNTVNHLTYFEPYIMRYYDATDEPWADPTGTGLTGYARNGKKYTSGVEDPGPVWAPWATEAQSVNRGPRDDFPLKSLLVVTRQELVIFDLDSFDGTPASLLVWMRFTMPDTSYFRAIGRGAKSIQSIVMKNGQLVVVTKHNGVENGGLICVDFKATGQDVYSMIRSDTHRWGVSGKTIVNRNDTTTVWTTTGVSPSLRISSENVYSVDAFSFGTSTWIAIGGEDKPTQIIRFSGNLAQEVFNAVGNDVGDDETVNCRQVLFDENGWFWFTVGGLIFRNMLYYQDGVVLANKSDVRVGCADLGSTILELIQLQNDLYARTAEGIWRVGKGSMRAYLVYSTAGGSGRGKGDAAREGEILVGGGAPLAAMRGVSLETGGRVFSFLTVAVPIGAVGYGGAPEDYGGVTVIRMFDDVVYSYEFPVLSEPGALFSLSIPFA